MTKTCRICGEEFSRHPSYSHAQWAKAAYCSNACRGVGLRHERKLCACGCGERVSKPTSSWRQGHNPRPLRGTIILWHPPGRKPRYIFRDRNGKTIYFARAVMMGHLRRHLAPGEEVDHVNGDSTDDRVENLMLFASHGEHMRYEYERGRLILN